MNSRTLTDRHGHHAVTNLTYLLVFVLSTLLRAKSGDLDLEGASEEDVASCQSSVKDLRDVTLWSVMHGDTLRSYVINHE